jgi:fatty acid desaturase
MGKLTFFYSSVNFFHSSPMSLEMSGKMSSRGVSWVYGLTGIFLFENWSSVVIEEHICRQRTLGTLLLLFLLILLFLVRLALTFTVLLFMASAFASSLIILFVALFLFLLFVFCSFLSSLYFRGLPAETFAGGQVSAGKRPHRLACDKTYHYFPRIHQRVL